MRDGGKYGCVQEQISKDARQGMQKTGCGWVDMDWGLEGEGAGLT